VIPNVPAPLVVEQHLGWTRLLLSRPDSRNALDRHLISSLRAAIVAADRDPTIHAIVLGGAGGAFCSGLDLDELRRDRHDVVELLDELRRLHVALLTTSTPLIGACEKFAINAGVALALACDLLIAGDSTFIQVGEISQGMGIPMNAAWLRIRTTEATAMRLALGGDRIPAREAHRLGLFAEVVDDDSVMDRAVQLAVRLAGFPAGGPALVKRSVMATRTIDPETWLPGPDEIAAGFMERVR
jgi:enoyl-CoA hydratase/carnithine racemase